MRITQSTVVNQFLYNLQLNEQQLLKTQNEISSGKKIMLPEDDPAGSARALQLQSSIDATSQYLANDTQAKSWIQATDSALQGVDSILQHIRNLALEANSAGETPSQLADLAKTMVGLRDELVTVADSQLNGQYLFSGQAVDTQPYAPPSASAPLAPFTYNGDTGAIMREIGPSVHIQVNVTGDVFASALNDINTLIGDLQNPTYTPNVGWLPAGHLQNLDTDLSSIQTVEAESGSTLQRITSNNQRLQDLKTNLQAWLANTQNLDVARATVKLQQQQTAYQEALAVGARLQQTTLLNYLQP